MTVLFAFAAVALAVTPFAVATPSPTTSQSCSKTEFYHSTRDCCLPSGGVPSPPPAPSGKSCPQGSGGTSWYWHTEQDCCVPAKPLPSGNPSPTCQSGHQWQQSSQCCSAPGPSKPSSPTPGPSSSCSKNEFFYPTKSCCLPSGGNPSAPSPPPGKSCPVPSGKDNSWYWHEGKGCCVPSSPLPPSNPGTPSCRPGHGWQVATQCCAPSTPTTPTPPPKPSAKPGHGGSGWRRSPLSRSNSICPKNLQACPIPGTIGGIECVDTQDLESCGGCVSTGEGQNCNAIKGVKLVGCEQSICKVSTCVAGYQPSSDGTSCIPL